MGCDRIQKFDLRGKTIVLTGATSGIGFATAKLLVQNGAYVIGVGRSEARNQQAKMDILTETPNAKVDYLLANLANQSEVKRLSEGIKSTLANNQVEFIDVLVNNAGIYLEKKHYSQDGIEKTFAVNHLAPFLLSHELLSFLALSEHGRIITVSSHAHRKTPVLINRLSNPWPYIGLLAYKRSKLCNVLFTYEFNRIVDEGILALVVDPGLVDTSIASKGSNGVSDWVWRWRRKSGTSADIPAKTIAYLSGEKKIDRSRGFYYKNCEPTTPSKLAKNKRLAKKLWELSCKLTGTDWH